MSLELTLKFPLTFVLTNKQGNELIRHDAVGIKICNTCFHGKNQQTGVHLETLLVDKTLFLLC